MSRRPFRAGVKSASVILAAVVALAMGAASAGATPFTYAKAPVQLGPWRLGMPLSAAAKACGQDWKFKDGTVRGAVYTCGAHEIGVRRAIVVAIDLTYPESSKQDFDGALEDSMKRYGLPTQNRSGYDALFGSAWEAVWRAKRVEYQIYFSMGGVTDARALSYTLRILDGMHCPAEPRAGGFRTCSESMHACEKWGGPCLPADRVWCMTRMGFRWRGEICFATAAECQRNYNLVSSEHHPTTCKEQSGHVATPR